MVTRSEQVAKARQRRLHPTAAQARLRQLIRDHGDRLRRQMLFGTSVVHFVLPYRNLLINVFGERCPRDKSQAKRLDGWLRSLGFNYLELTAAEVFDLPQTVIEAIESFPECRAAHQKWLASRRIARKYSLRKVGAPQAHDFTAEE